MPIARGIFGQIPVEWIIRGQAPAHVEVGRDHGDVEPKSWRRIGRVKARDILEEIILAGVIEVAGGARGRPGGRPRPKVLLTPPIGDSIADGIDIVKLRDFSSREPAPIDADVVHRAAEQAVYTRGGSAGYGQRGD